MGRMRLAGNWADKGNLVGEKFRRPGWAARDVVITGMAGNAAVTVHWGEITSLSLNNKHHEYSSEAKETESPNILHFSAPYRLPQASS